MSFFVAGACVQKLLLMPNTEDRYFDPVDHGCSCDLRSLPGDFDLHEFWLMGKKKFLEDAKLLDQCKEILELHPKGGS